MLRSVATTELAVAAGLLEWRVEVLTGKMFVDVVVVGCEWVCGV